MDGTFRPELISNSSILQSQANQQPSSPRPKKKPCCVCKMSKKLRDSCIRNNNEEICLDFITAHKICLRAKGFRVD
eukprot:403371739